MVACANCGRENPDDARFCNACGAAFAAAPRREERKLVTVLFADLVGFTSRAEKLDPEDVRAVLHPYWERLRHELERFGGTVEKFIGDAAMALFGAPVAHEDDPERAVRAALAIRDWVRESGEDLQVRIAVNTGEALVLLDARPAEGEGMAAGDVVNTAARLQSAAPVNGIIVGETTYRATRHAIDYVEHRPITAKGKSEPLSVWEAVQARSRLGVDLVTPPWGPLIGRDHELELLLGAFARSRREARAQLVTVVGVPGIGKSRLVGELAERLRAGDDLVTWRQGRSLPYGDGVTFWALGEMVKAQSGILETDSPEDASARLAASVAAVVSDDADWVEERLHPLVGLGGDVGEDSFAAWRRFLESLAEERPLVLVFEDIHWADDGLLDFIDHLVEWASGVSLFVLATARPELLNRRPTWGGGKPNAQTFSLAPLSEEETAKLVHVVLAQTVMPAEQQEAVLSRAGGNPLYAEQFARLLAEHGTIEELPETVHGIIAARLDALADDEKSVLQDAAVLGKVFWSGAVATVGDRAPAVTEQLLHALERKEFVARARRSSVANESEYSFRHVLVRDVAYSQIPRAGRAARHRAVAHWIERLGRPEDRAEMLAHHLITALDLAQAAGTADDDLVVETTAALIAAAERAARLQSRPAALAFYRRALELLPRGDSRRGRLLLRAGQAAADAAADDASALLTEAAALLQAQGDRVGAAEAEATRTLFLWWGDPQEVERLERASALVADEPDSRGRAYVYAQLGRVLALHERAAEAEGTLTHALDIADRLGLDDLRPQILHYRGLARAHSGDPSGRGDIERSIELARLHDRTFVARGLNNYAATLFYAGELPAALAVSREMLAYAEELGTRSMITQGHMVQSGLLLELGDWSGALEHFSAVRGDPLFDAAAASFVAFVNAARGTSTPDEVAAVLELNRATGDTQPAMSVLAAGIAAYADLGLERETPDLIRRYIGLARRFPTPHYGFSPIVALTARRLGLLSELADAFATTTQSRWLDALRALFRDDLAEAARLLDDMRIRTHAAYVRLASAEEGSVELAREAACFFREVGAAAPLARSEALLSASA